jgi:hypothetical protein
VTYFNTPDGPMLEGSSPARLGALLAEYEVILEALGGRVTSTMSPGLDCVEAEVKLASRGLRCPDEVAVWFGWHNGVRLVNGRRWGGIPLFHPHSLDEALHIYDLNRDELDRSFAEGIDYESATYGAGEGWIQLDPLSESIAVECVRSGAAPPRVRWANVDFADSNFQGKFRAVSLCTSVSSWIESAQNGAFTWLDAEQRWNVHREHLVVFRTGSILG